MALSRFKTPEYLLHYPSGIFVFRAQVPRDRRPVIPLAELRYSLKTRCAYTIVLKLRFAISFLE